MDELSGEPGPEPNEYDVVLAGKSIEPLSQKLTEVGIGVGTAVCLPDVASDCGHRNAHRYPASPLGSTSYPNG